MSKAVLGILVLFAIPFILFFHGLLGAVLWFCIDDTVAKLTDNPNLGNLSFWFAFTAVYLISLLVKSGSASVNQNRNN